MRLRLLTGLLVLSSLLAACSGSDSSTASPDEVAAQFFSAVQADDEPGFMALLTPAARAGVQAGDGFSIQGDRVDEFEITGSTITGGESEVLVVLTDDGDDQEFGLLLREIEEGWRIHGMRAAFGDGYFTIDLEHVDEELAGLGEEIAEGLGDALAETLRSGFEEMQNTWEQGGTLEEIAAERAHFDSVTAVSEEAHDRAWRIDLSSDGRSALEMLTSVCESQGLRVEAGEFAKQLDENVTLEFRGVSRVEAVERIAEAVGLHPVWPKTESQEYIGTEKAEAPPLTFAGGPRPWPATFTGPFLVEVTDVQENTPSPTGQLAMAVRALGLEPGVLAYADEMLEMLRIDRVRSAQDVALANEDMSHMTTPSQRGGYLVYELQKDLTGLLRGVETLATVRGEVRLKLPTRVEQVTVTRTSGPVATSLGDLETESWGPSSSFQISGEDLDGHRLITSPRKEDGSPLGVQFSGSSGWNKRLDANLQCPEEPHAVDFKICRDTQLTYTYELAPVPLREFAQRPAKIEPLRFAGAAPLSFALVGGLKHENGMAQATLRAQNHSNKAVLSAMVNFRYFDAAGTELEDFPHTLSGEYDFDLGESAPLVLAGKTIETSSHAAFAPENTKSIRFELQSAEFQDGTTWEAESK